MYAIVKTGGKQYRVERGQRLLVERLSAEEGASVALQPLMYRSDEAVFDAKGLEQVKVTAKVLSHERGEKLRIVKFKPKRGYKRRTGHRQDLTRIEITEIAMGKAKAVARKAAPQAAASSSEPRGSASQVTKPAGKPAAASAAPDAETAAPEQAKPPREESDNGT